MWEQLLGSGCRVPAPEACVPFSSSFGISQPAGLGGGGADGESQQEGKEGGITHWEAVGPVIDPQIHRGVKTACRRVKD